MKKIAFTILIILCHQALLAQRHTPMDTIVGREPTYYYQHWFDSADFHNDTRKCQICLRASSTTMEIAKYNYTDSTLKVVGIAAATVSVYTPDPPAPIFPQCADTSFDNWYEKLILYKPTNTGMVVLDSGSYTVLDTSRMMKLFSHYLNLSMDTFATTIRYVPIYEVYFDEPITVTTLFTYPPQTTMAWWILKP